MVTLCLFLLGSEDKVEVIFDWEGSQPNHLTISKGDIIIVKQRGEGWWMGNKDGKVHKHSHTHSLTHSFTYSFTHLFLSPLGWVVSW